MAALRVLLLHGAIGNGGDFLIRQRGRQLVSSVLPDATLTEVRRDGPIPDVDVDVAVLVGGPIVTSAMHPHAGYVRAWMNRNPDTPIRALGVGVGGHRSTHKGYFRGKDVVAFWRRIASHGAISVRDVASQRVFENAGLAATLTGCPALYAPWRHQGTAPSGEGGPWLISIPDVPTRIAVRKLRDGARILWALRRDAAGAHVLFQHGIEGPVRPLVRLADRLGYVVVDGLGGSLADNPAITDCRGHIGTRLHAGILFHSLQRPSYLLDVDNRTAGFLETFPAPGGPLRDLRAGRDWLRADPGAHEPTQAAIDALYEVACRFVDQSIVKPSQSA